MKLTASKVKLLDFDTVKCESGLGIRDPMLFNFPIYVCRILRIEVPKVKCGKRHLLTKHTLQSQIIA